MIKIQKPQRIFLKEKVPNLLKKKILIHRVKDYSDRILNYQKIVNKYFYK